VVLGDEQVRSRALVAHSRAVTDWLVDPFGLSGEYARVESCWLAWVFRLLSLLSGGVGKVRIILHVRAQAGPLAWDQVLTPGRGLIYRALADHDPDLGRQLHDLGFGPYRLRPFCFCPPTFPSAPRVTAAYSIGGSGSVAFGSPLLVVGEAVAKAVAGLKVLQWATVPLEVGSVAAVDPPRFLSGQAEWRTATPVVVKGGHPDRFLLPDQPGWLEGLLGNLQRKAATLGLDEAVEVELLWAGARRLFRVDGSARIGAPVMVRVLAAPETLAGIWSWGLGQANSAGFGWIA
jgi:CRISPR-associated endoribonuclease Cas6